MTTVAGTVLDATGAAASGCIVRAYRRDTGALLGEAVTSSGATALIFRYVRFRQITASGYLEISELRVFDGTTHRTGTISSSNTPDGGSVADLTDGSLSTRCYWSAGTAGMAGFWIQLDFGNAYAIDSFKQGGFDTGGRHIQAATIEGSNNGTDWTPIKYVSGLPYPGNYALSAPIDLTGETLPVGHYLIDCGTYTGELQVVCLDDEAGTLQNDQILRTFGV